MLGEYSIMDWVTLGGIITATSGIIGIIVKLFVDKNVLLAKFTLLSSEHEALSKEHEALSKEHEALSKEHGAIKKDTEYISDEMKFEKMAREKLYENSSRAKEILETMDMMKEVVLQNAQLNAENASLNIRNQELVQSQNNTTDYIKFLNAINRFESRLAEFEGYSNTEEIQFVLTKIKNELSEYDNQ